MKDLVEIVQKVNSHASPPIDVNKMLQNISVITSLRSLNMVRSCNFTFILIGERVLNILSLHAICIMSNKLANLKSNMFCVDSCDLYFPTEMNQLFSACNSEFSMSFPCSSNPTKENTNGKRTAIGAHAEHLFSFIGIDFKRCTTKSVHKSCNKNVGIVVNDSSQYFEQFDLGVTKLELLNQLCCLQEIFILPPYQLFAGTQKSFMNFIVVR
jgi:hypothetical protein